MTGQHELFDADRKHAHTVFVQLDLFRHSYDQLGYSFYRPGWMGSKVKSQDLTPRWSLAYSGAVFAQCFGSVFDFITAILARTSIEVKLNRQFPKVELVAKNTQ